jgi:hypothetical protein
LKIDLNTCYTVTWASSTEHVLATNSAGQPINAAGSPYVAGTTTLIGKDEYTYTTVHLPSNGTNEFSFDDVYRAAIRDVFVGLWEDQRSVNRLFDSILLEYKPAGAQ